MKSYIFVSKKPSLIDRFPGTTALLIGFVGWYSLLVYLSK